MKITRLRFSAAMLAALSTLSLLGCGGGGTSSGGGSLVTADASKYWYESSRTENGVAKGCYAKFTDDPKVGTDDANPCVGYTFGSDGKYSVYNYQQKEFTGSYSTSGSAFTLDLGTDGSTGGTYSVNESGDTMTLTSTVGGINYVATFRLVTIPS